MGEESQRTYPIRIMGEGDSFDNSTQPTGVKWIKELTKGTWKALVWNFSGESLSWIYAS